MKLEKIHFRVMLKIYLDGERKSVNTLLTENEEKAYNELVEAGYIETVNRFYAHIPTKCGFPIIVENMLESMVILSSQLN